MLHKTRGIVFKYFKYRDTSIIVKIFTEAFGLQTYVVNGVRSKTSRGKIALYQPLTLLDMVVYYKDSAEINRISEVKCRSPFQSISTNIKKTAIAMFLAEVLYKTVKEEGEVAELFDFIFHSIEILDHVPEGFENFHLQFLLKLARYLGFGVESSEIFYDSFPEEDVEPVKQLLMNPYEQRIKISNTMRRILLDHIIKFYQTHIDTLKEVKSVKVLQEVL
ncbi:DNA recombination and repair protein RecO [Fulvivirga imtechensis AK7]|uniref:DNA repair protein RecO n=1 Tax=Fulvivirga imtechensis AK7 TaxID=1237149 RepID=L8JUH7_9BACT|nr:DNA repair protein RecO [Fulvivirga imtechensis]ELR72656.1 DNA recombination and repair protein RecO [Fulvivirga imtechensis AK7]